MNGRFWCHTDSVELIIFSVISLLSGSSCAYACKSGLNSLLYFNHRVKNIRRRTGKTRTLREKVLFLKNKAAPLQGYINTANSCSTIEAEHSAITTLAGHQSGSLRVPSSLWHAVSPCWRGCALSKQPCLQASSQARCAAAV